MVSLLFLNFSKFDNSDLGNSEWKLIMKSNMFISYNYSGKLWPETNHCTLRSTKTILHPSIKVNKSIFLKAWAIFFQIKHWTRGETTTKYQNSGKLWMKSKHFGQQCDHFKSFNWGNRLKKNALTVNKQNLMSVWASFLQIKLWNIELEGKL